MKQVGEEGRGGRGRVEVRVGARCCGKPGTQGSWCPACCAIHSAFVLGCSELPCDADGHRGSEPRFQGDCSVWCENRQYLQDSLLSDILTTGTSGRCSLVVFSMQIFTMLRTRKGFFFFQFKMPNRWWQLLSLFWRLDASQLQF